MLTKGAVGSRSLIEPGAWSAPCRKLLPFLADFARAAAGDWKRKSTKVDDPKTLSDIVAAVVNRER